MLTLHHYIIPVIYCQSANCMLVLPVTCLSVRHRVTCPSHDYLSVTFYIQETLVSVSNTLVTVYTWNSLSVQLLKPLNRISCNIIGKWTYCVHVHIHRKFWFLFREHRFLLEKILYFVQVVGLAHAHGYQWIEKLFGYVYPNVKQIWQL